MTHFIMLAFELAEFHARMKHIDISSYCLVSIISEDDIFLQKGTVHQDLTYAIGINVRV